MGCGEGQYTCEIAQRYPSARVIGMDVDAASVQAAAAVSASQANVRFLVHDARQPMAETVGIDAVVMARRQHPCMRHNPSHGCHRVTGSRVSKPLA